MKNILSQRLEKLQNKPLKELTEEERAKIIELQTAIRNAHTAYLRE
jgi:hypothetical protein